MPLHQTHEPSLRGLLDSAAEFLAGAKVPQGPFDPAGAWRQSYAVWLKDRKEGRVGSLALQRTPGPDGTFELRADWRVEQSTKGFQHVQADIVCSADELATPRSWKSQSRILQPSGQAIDDLTVAEQAAVKGGVVEFSDGRRLFAGNPLKAWTSNFSLLEAVQRLGGRQIEPLAFSLLDFLDVRKDDHRLWPLGEAEVELGGRHVRLIGFQHVGQGILPFEYWLDGHRRLVLAWSGLVGYLAVEEGAKA